MRMDSKLYWAAFYGEIEIFKEKVKELDLTKLLTLEENTVVHVNIISSKTSDESFTKEILGMCPQLLLQTNARGETPLLMAARYGHVSIVEFLINRAKLLCLRDDLENEEVVKQMMRMKNAENDTALHEAVRFGHLEIVRIWIREDPHFSYYSANEAGETPLYLAIQAGYAEVAHEILDNCTSPHTGGPNGRTIMHAAIYDIDLMRKILEKVEYLTKQVDEEGCTPLHLAASFYDRKIVEILLEKDESCGYIRNKKGKTALHIAAQYNWWSSNVMEGIMLRCPNSCEIVDNEGRNVLHYAVREEDISMVKAILEHCSESNELLNGKDIDGNTPFLLMGATSSWNPQILGVLLSHPRVNKMASNKQNINILDMVDAYCYYDRDRDDNDEDTKVKKELGKLVRKYPITKTLYIPKLNFDEHDEEINLQKERGKRKAARKAEMERKISSFITKYTESTLVTATLIATVTFTAGFTLPGGFFGNEVAYRQQGTAILKQNTAFQAFIITTQ